MILVSIIDFLRVLFAFLLVFGVVPLIGDGYRVWQGEPFDQSPREWIPVLLRAFIRVSFALEIFGVLLGHLKLFLPGVLVSACLLWCLRGIWVGLQKRSSGGEQASQAVWRSVFAYLEKDGSLRHQRPVRPVVSWNPLNSARFLPLSALLVVAMLVEIWTPLQQVHFEHQQTYSRAVSLGALTQGQNWDGDPSIPILSPLVSFSGLGAAPVIRYTGPILAVTLMILAAICAWRAWECDAAPLFVLIFFLFASAANGSSPWEPLPGSIALIYGMAAVLVWLQSRRDSILASLTAVMVSGGDWLPLLFCALVFASVFIASRISSPKLLRVPALLTVLLAIYMTVLGQHGRAGTPSYHYESAARTCEAIGRDFHRNEWLVVSPFQELACTYGQGWHVELSSFVSKFTVDQVSRPEFLFPYDLPDVFFFVEREPFKVGALPHQTGVSWRYSPAESSDWSAFLYGDAVGRASLEFRAAELLNAYKETHSNISVFYQDASLTVYHIVRKGGAT